MEKLNGRQYGSIDSKPITHSNEMAKDSQSSNPLSHQKLRRTSSYGTLGPIHHSKFLFGLISQ